jgi:hypothetical protein
MAQGKAVKKSAAKGATKTAAKATKTAAAARPLAERPITPAPKPGASKVAKRAIRGAQPAAEAPAASADTQQAAVTPTPAKAKRSGAYRVNLRHTTVGVLGFETPANVAAVGVTHVGPYNRGQVYEGTKSSFNALAKQLNKLAGDESLKPVQRTAARKGAERVERALAGGEAAAAE